MSATIHRGVRRSGAAAVALMAPALALGPVCGMAWAQADRPNRGGGVIINLAGEPLDISFEQPSALPTPEQLNSVQVDPHLRELVRQLDDSSFAVREQAAKQLREATSDKLQLYALLIPGRDLSAEQRYRLLAALREHLIKMPRGALGISMAPAFPMQPQPGEPEGVRVQEVLPGLPAEKLLKVGDRITHIDAQPLVLWGDLTRIVQSHKPGERVTLVVKRPQVDANGNALRDATNNIVYDLMQIEIELASAELLKTARLQNQFNLPNQQTMPQPLSPVELSRLKEAMSVARQCGPQPQVLAVRGGAGTLLAATARNPLAPTPGEGDGSELDVDQDPAIQMLMQQRQQIATGQIPDDQARWIRQSWQARLNELFRQAKDPNLPARQRAQLQRVAQRFMDLMQL